ncbi:MAG: NUDIX domain-containing protein [Anaerolineae bacterium]
MSDKIYQQGLAKKRLSAGALFLDEMGRVLLVEPVYKRNWEIPGGVVELGESPRQACVREVREELGLARPFTRLLVVDYIAESAEKVEGLAFIFDGGVLAAEIAQIRLPVDELQGLAFVDVGAVDGRLNSRLAARVRMAVEARALGQTFYLENQSLIG